MSPLFTIIIPTYNRPLSLEGAVNSILAQSFDDYEIIIIDDGSKPNVDLSIKDERIKLFHFPNQGRSQARNEGLEKAKGDFILFLDDDDEMYPGFLKTASGKIKGDEKKVLYKFLLEHHSSQGRIIEPMNNAKDAEDFFKQVLFNGLSTLQVCLPITLARSSQFDINMESCEDQDYFLKLLKANKDIRISEHDITSALINHENDLKPMDYIVNDFKFRNSINLRHGKDLSFREKIRKNISDHRIFISQLVKRKKLLKGIPYIIFNLKNILKFYFT